MNFEGILRNYQRINFLTRSLIHRPAFSEVNLPLPSSRDPELDFVFAVSWLYCFYFEAGRISLTFLRRLGENHSIMNRESSEQHLETVRSLRTELHHNLGYSGSDLTARTTVESWRRRICGAAFPEKPGEWKICFDHLIDDSVIFLNDINRVVRHIESDMNNAEQLLGEWLRRLSRDYPLDAIDLLIDNTKHRLGRHGLNTTAFRNRHVGKWRQSLDLLDDDFDFDFEVTRLIEKTLLEVDGVILPITGENLINDLGIQPGSKVGAFLEEARRYFEVHRCGKDELMNHLSGYKESIKC